METGTEPGRQGGGRRWVIVVATFTIHMITHGLIYSFGILFMSLEDRFNGNKAEIAWVGSLVSGTMYLGGPVAGYFSSRFGFTPVVVVGALLAFLGNALSLFVTNLYLLYLTMGILTGIGFSFLYQPAVVCVTLNFKEYLTIACGLSSCGCGIGAFIFSPLMNYLLNTYSWYGTVLLRSAIILHCIPCGLLLLSFTGCTKLQTKQKHSKNRYSDTDVIQYTKDSRNNEKLIYAPDVSISDKYCKTQNGTQVEESDKYKQYCLKDVTLTKNNAENTTCLVSSKVDIQIENGFCCDGYKRDNTEKDENVRCSALLSTCKTDIFKKPVFLLYAISQFMFFLGQYIPFIYFPGHLRTMGVESATGVWVISTIGISSILGRIVLGYLADKTSINRTRLFALVLLVGGLATEFVHFYHSVPVLFLYASVFGICAGTGVTLISVVLVDLLGTSQLNQVFGMANLFCGFGTLLGPPLAGLILDASKAYAATFITAGTAFLIGGVCLLIAPVFQEELPRARGQ